MPGGERGLLCENIGTSSGVSSSAVLMGWGGWGSVSYKQTKGYFPRQAEDGQRTGPERQANSHQLTNKIGGLSDNTKRLGWAQADSVPPWNLTQVWYTAQENWELEASLGSKGRG